MNRAERVYYTLKANKLVKDTVETDTLNLDIMENFEESKRKLMVENAYIAAQGNLENLKSFRRTLKDKQKLINGYNVEFHKRIAFSIACLGTVFCWKPFGIYHKKGRFWLTHDYGDRDFCDLLLYFDAWEEYGRIQ